ncbi:MAG: hypothetical protein WEH44_07900, partial [Pirellulaceae bacterium]
SGSQNAASSFSLNSGNRNPSDIVTDGVHLWVLNNTTTDKVFKYTLAGSLVGSWTISTSGASAPTGITLDPASPSHLWIVDSGTDRVYQYDNAVGLTSGSLAASTSFALAAGNTNPQGIADPPVTGGANLLSSPPRAARAEVDARLLEGRADRPRRAAEVDRLHAGDLLWLDQAPLRPMGLEPAASEVLRSKRSDYAGGPASREELDEALESMADELAEAVKRPLAAI